MATDSGRFEALSASVQVQITVDDVNDNKPIFKEYPFRAKVAALIQPGKSLLKIEATDLDAALNGEIIYSLSYDQSNEHDETNLNMLDKFRINARTGVISATQSLASNANRLLHIQVSVHIHDVNDNAPQFVSPAAGKNTIDSNVYLKSTARAGETVAHVLAIDKDSGKNARISYAIVSGNDAGYFSINSTTGYIGLVKPLPATVFKSESDASMFDGSKFNLIVSASDHGINPNAKQSLLNLNFIIERVATVAPRFLQAVYQASISENEQTGTFVLQVSAKSYNAPRANVNLTYEIPTGVANNHFHVDSQRGIITTLGQLDRETNAQYRIPIYVYDSNSLQNDIINAATGRKQRSSTENESAISEQFDVATVIITVTDMNDQAPEFRPGSCYALAVPENAPSSIIHTVRATDLDEGANSEILYNIIGGNVGNKFSIDMQTGELRAQMLDREQQSRYLLQIQAQDRGSPISYQGHCNITVLVEDLNDNKPQFEQIKYTANIAENVSVGSSVLRVQATDADSGVNARLTYKLANETHWLFTIDPKSGIITTAG